MISLARRQRRHPHMDMTPLIDIVFLLLVFFLLTSSFLQPTALELTLPAAESASKPALQVPLTLAVDASGRLALNGMPVETPELGERLRLANFAEPEAALLIQADQAVPVQTLVRIMESAQRAGISRLSVAARKAAP